MESFNILIKNEKVKLYQRLAWFILILNGASFIVLSFNEVFVVGALGILVLYLLMRNYLVRKNKVETFLDEYAFFIPGLVWLGIQNYLIAFLCILLGFLYKVSVQKLRFVITSEHVMKMNFPKKQFDWNSISNLVLKDNILTLDFANNKLIQTEIAPEQNINEPMFNTFTQSQIERSKINLNS